MKPSLLHVSLLASVTSIASADPFHADVEIDPLAYALDGDSVHVGVLRLDAGGCIGRHPTVQRQILLLVEGDASVSGDVGQPSVELTPGQAAVWEPGESHETTSRTGMTALVIEGDFDRL